MWPWSLAHNELRVVHVSTHVSLREACDRVKKDRVLDVIRIANEGCKAIGIKAPPRHGQLDDLLDVLEGRLAAQGRGPQAEGLGILRVAGDVRGLDQPQIVHVDDAVLVAGLADGLDFCYDGLSRRRLPQALQLSL